jgi:hypothetical protein
MMKLMCNVYLVLSFSVLQELHHLSTYEKKDGKSLTATEGMCLLQKDFHQAKSNGYEQERRLSWRFDIKL